MIDVVSYNTVQTSYLQEGGSFIRSLLSDVVIVDIEYYVHRSMIIVSYVVTHFWDFLQLVIISVVVSFAILILFLPLWVLIDNFYKLVTRWFVIRSKRDIC